MHRPVVLLAAALLGLLAASPARAGLLFAFDQSNYTTTAGGAVDVRVFLREVGGTVLQDDGLLTAGVRVFFDDPGPASPARVLGVGDLSGNPAFDDANSPTRDVVAGVSAGLAVFADIASPPVFPDAAMPDRIFLGTFRFTAGTAGGEVTTIRATRYDPAGQSTLTGALDLLDESNFGEATATISVPSGGPAPVPEPASGWLAVTAGLSLLGYRGFRRAAARWLG